MFNENMVKKLQKFYDKHPEKLRKVLLLYSEGQANGITQVRVDTFDYFRDENAFVSAYNAKELILRNL